MRMQKSTLASALLIGLSAAPLTSVAAEISATVGAANMYYWRGFDLGNGTPAVWGELNASAAGFYGGIWTSSGDSTSVEYDLYLGYGGSVGGFTYDASVWTYAYPSAADPVRPGDLMEAVIGLGYGPVSVAYYHGLEDLDDYWYTTVGLDVGAFNLTYGLHEDDYAHLDLTYAYSENLSFTVGAVVDDANLPVSDDPKFVVSFVLPIN